MLGQIGDIGRENTAGDNDPGQQQPTTSMSGLTVWRLDRRGGRSGNLCRGDGLPCLRHRDSLRLPGPRARSIAADYWTVKSGLTEIITAAEAAKFQAAKLGNWIFPACSGNAHMKVADGGAVGHFS